MSKRSKWLAVWALGAVLLIWRVDVGGESGYAERVQALTQASQRTRAVNATAVRQLVLPVKRLTRRGPREEMLPHTEYRYNWQGRDYTGQRLGDGRDGEQFEVYVDEQHPEISYGRPPEEELKSLRSNHQGTVAVNRVFLLSMWGFFLFWLSSRGGSGSDAGESAPAPDAAPPKSES